MPADVSPHPDTGAATSAGTPSSSAAPPGAAPHPPSAAGDTAPTETGGPRSATSRSHLVWLLVLALTGAAAAVILPGMLSDPAAVGPTAAGLALVPLFALTEVVVIHLPTQRNAYGHTLREVPAVVGLTFLAPQEYVLVYVVGTVSALFLVTRMRGVKLAFNSALFAFEAGLGAAVYHLVLAGGDPISPTGWLAALAAVVATDLISAAAITTAISVTEGVFDGDVLREALRSGLAAACINTCVALLVATLLIVRPTSLPLLAVVVVLLVLGYRVYITLARGHARTQLLYRFVDRTATAQALDDVIRVVLTEAADLMHAESAHLLETTDDPGRVRCHSIAAGGTEPITTLLTLPGHDDGGGGDGGVGIGGGTPWWHPALEGRPLLLAAGRQGGGDADQEPDEGRDDGRHDAPDDVPAPTSAVLPAHPRDAVAAPLRAARGVRAALVVCDRSFDQETFGRDDVQVFATLASHAAVAIERADTVHRLEQMVEQRAHDALHDPLSGLPNRRAFNEAVARAMADVGRVRAQDSGAPARGVVLLLDLDDFKDVNDTLGHSAGDRLITESGERLRHEAAGMVARLGGDEFAVLLPGMTLAEGLRHAQHLHAALSAPVPLDDVDLIVSSSIGVAEFSSAASTAEELLAQADVAMYTAKAARSGVAVYRPEEGDSTARRLALAADLPQALAVGDIRLWYQPQADPRTGTIAGFEALMRWHHPVFGMVPPPEIVAVAHRTGRVRSLTDDLIRQALSARHAWAEAGHPLAVSVNVTPADIADPMLVSRVRLELARSATPAEALVLEVTESDAMKDPERSLEVLTALSALGVTLSVDDFGTGYSSLAYLDRLPVKEVKVDQSFIIRMQEGTTDPTVLRATIGLAHDLGLRVVAEGVESESARVLVRDLGVDLYQGFGLARPMTAPDVLGWLERY
ncbi:bifunctional diguanylate cyclase/phosphodiesterase [Nocardioides sp. HDW12B]|uniref:putative bifunctional diguanylate cyclase/phosphodiesterase n=1 Tax=Nocardioides sp. HDW12B TaxID=2714939 RepID=UPI00140B8E4F|nr:bifunctional diguanylate cyclase/phosphodiesterase [Nocardioides sp. HDW12B]QIK66426.1 bifunctional diguanylate cyclase/phosphodiesterase [Nocardioides sp. HDW12B]